MCFGGDSDWSYLSKLAILGGEKTVQLPTYEWPIDFLKRYGQREADAVTAVIRSGVVWGTFAPQISAFEKEFAEYIRVKYSIFMNSGTAALHCAMAAAGVQPGDEVITSPHTFIGSASAILQQGAIPVFADIDPSTYTMDPSKVEAKVSSATKVIEPVHIYGLPADMDAIQKIADAHSLVVVEDACQAHGAEYKGKKVGSIGAMGAFSFNGTKNMQTGEGGMFVTNSDEYAGTSERVRIFGESLRPGVPRPYMAGGMGWNYKSNEITAAFGRVQLSRLDETNRARIEMCEFLTDRLRKLPGLVPPFIPDYARSVYHYYKIRVDPTKLGSRLSAREFRDRIVVALQAEGVRAAIWCARPIYMQPLFRAREGWGKGFPWKSPYATREIVYPPGLCPVAERISDETFNLSLHPPNGLDLMEQYAQAFEKVIENANVLQDVKVPPWEEWWGGFVPSFGKQKEAVTMEEISGYR
jgi:dTDP-4-amino-4,6-dideoxygalactose transaminase